MSDVHALVGAYAADAVDDVERAAFERHLATCQACRLELEGMHETAALLASTEPVTPPARLREQVLAGIETVRPLPPVTTPTAVPGRRWFRPATLVAAAAAAIALVGGVTVWQAQEEPPGQEQQQSAAERVLSAPDAEEYRKTLPDGTEVTLVRSRSRNEAVLVAEGMPPAPEGKVYELWLDHEEVGMVPAGTMRGSEEQVVLEGDPATAIGAGITVEPAPGSEEPTTQPLTTFAFDSA